MIDIKFALKYIDSYISRRDVIVGVKMACVGRLVRSRIHDLANVTAIGNAIENIYENVGMSGRIIARKDRPFPRGIRDRYIRSESLLRLTEFD